MVWYEAICQNGEVLLIGCIPQDIQNIGNTPAAIKMGVLVMAANGYEISILSAVGEILQPYSFSIFVIIVHLVVRPFRVAIIAKLKPRSTAFSIVFLMQLCSGPTIYHEVPLECDGRAV